MQGVIEAFLVIKNRAPIGLLKASMPDATRQKLHVKVVSRLKETAAATQKKVLEHLGAEKTAGRVLNFKSYWIDNYLFVRCTKETLLKLAERNDVTEVFENPKLTLVTPVEKSEAAAFAPASLTGRAEPNLVAIGCRQMWKRGLTGKGRLVCTLDVGIDGDHRALNTRWRGLRPGVASAAAWFDPVQNLDFPHVFDYPSSDQDHGTHVLGTICGLDTAITSIIGTDTTIFVDTLGVAPEADWISAAVIDNFANGSGILDAFEWAADPDGNPNTIEDVPDVVNNSWAYTSVGNGNNVSCHPIFWQAIDNLEAAGSVVVLAAGNRTDPLSSRSIGNPADRGTSPFSSFAVGNYDTDSIIVDSTNTDSLVRVTGTVAKSSCIGPTECGPDSLKPEVVAPGTSIYSAFAGNQFGTLTGTSMAAPHVAGAVALLRQYNPNATVDTIKRAIAMSASDVGASGPDTISGYGLINLPKALTLMPPNQGIHIYVKNDSIADSDGQAPYAGGIFDIYLTLTNNGVEPAGSLTGRLSSTDGKSTVLWDSAFFGNLLPGGAVSNGGQPFRIQLVPGLITGERFHLALNLSGEAGFSQALDLTFTVGERLVKNLFHHRNGNVLFTVSNFGSYGFETGSLEWRSLPGWDEGLGFERKTEPNVSRLFEGSFMAGLNDSMVSNTASNEFCCFPQVFQSPDADFAVHLGGNLQSFKPGPSGGWETFSIFDDRLANRPLGLAVSQRSFSFRGPGRDNFVLLEYTLKNESPSVWDGLRAGLFLDFTFFSIFGDLLLDKVDFDRSLHLGYQYHESAPAYRGIAAADLGGLSTFKAVRISPGVSNGFTLAEKWQTLSSGLTDTAVSSPIDAAMLAAKGPFTVFPGDSVKLAFALVAAATLDSLKIYTQTAQNIYRWMAYAGDLNADGLFRPSDVVLELYCVFLSQGDCPLFRTDLNCSGGADPPDVAYLLNRVFKGILSACP